MRVPRDDNIACRKILLATGWYFSSTRYDVSAGIEPRCVLPAAVVLLLLHEFRDCRILEPKSSSRKGILGPSWERQELIEIRPYHQMINHVIFLQTSISWLYSNSHLISWILAFLTFPKLYSDFNVRKTFAKSTSLGEIHAALWTCPTFGQQNHGPLRDRVMLYLRYRYQL